MLTFLEISVVKDGGSRQMKFTDEKGAIHEFYLRKAGGYGSKPAALRYTGLFKGNMTGDAVSKAEPVNWAATRQVCDALEKWSRLHDTAQYRELKTRWDDVYRRLEAKMNSDQFETIAAIQKELSDIESSEHWRNHVEEAGWLRQAILDGNAT